LLSCSLTVTIEYLQQHRAHLRRLGGLSWLLGALLWVGCGRIGLTLLPAEGSIFDPDGPSKPSDPSDPDDPSAGTDAATADPCAEDTDDDGTPDCEDECATDPAKVEPGLCGCLQGDTDTDGDGALDCMDACNGVDDASYEADASCGVGYCRTANTPSQCVAGLETACQPGSPLTSTDATCDGVDDNCDGSADENYAPSGPCGTGYCRTTSTVSSCAAGVEVACQPGARRASNDATADGVDDDCDGQTDEDACIARTETFGPGAQTLAHGPCRTLTVRLWGAAGAAGSGDGGAWVDVTGGQGGAGGYATSVVSLSAGALVQLYVGQGGQGCGRGGGAGGDAAYKGGAAGTGNGSAGTAGADGSVTGGTGPKSSGGKGGNGSYGGGGGGAGAKLWTNYGPGGDGGAATVLTVNGARNLVAGGGGGGGGAGSTFIASGASGASGGTGCGGNGASSGNEGGGGGGGGVCIGTTTESGSGRTPFDPGGGVLPAGVALGGIRTTDCTSGGNGYAIVTYGP
jgi:hypothetical protein